MLCGASRQPDRELAAHHGVRAEFIFVAVTAAGLTQLAGLIQNDKLHTRVGEILPLSDVQPHHTLRPGSCNRCGTRFVAWLLAMSACSAQAIPELAKVRCGWFENPTPANAWLTDRDGDWIIPVQGGHQANGDWPAFPRERRKIQIAPLPRTKWEVAQ